MSFPVTWTERHTGRSHTPVRPVRKDVSVVSSQDGFILTERFTGEATRAAIIPINIPK